MSIPSYPWVISKYKYPVCGCEQEQSRQWPWCHLGEWWQWSLLLASTGPGRPEAGGREDPDWTLVGATGARGDHRHPASCHSVILSYSNMTADKHIFLILLFCHCLKRHSIRVLTQNFCQTYFIYISRSTAAVKHRFDDNKENQMFNWMKRLDIQDSGESGLKSLAQEFSWGHDRKLCWAVAHGG